jgi:hypothetical protein
MNRTTKVRIHAVVDFRFAGAIGPTGSVIVGGGMAAAAAASAPAAQTLQGGLAGQSQGRTSAVGTPTTPSSSDPMSADAFLAALNSNPAGTVIYWRVE